MARYWLRRVNVMWPSVVAASKNKCVVYSQVNRMPLFALEQIVLFSFAEARSEKIKFKKTRHAALLKTHKYKVKNLILMCRLLVLKKKERRNY